MDRSTSCPTVLRPTEAATCTAITADSTEDLGGAPLSMSLASGTPVVATNVGAVPDLVQPGENGEIVPPRDADALAGALGRALASPRPPEQVRRSKAVKSWRQVADAVADATKLAYEI